MKARDIMVTNVITVSPEASVRQVPIVCSRTASVRSRLSTNMES
jgi:hypothetical protein